MLSILICGFDKYSEIWKTNLELFEKFWPDCNYKCYFSTEEKKVNSKRFRTICCGKNLSWSERTVKALSSITDKYVLLMLDDYFIINKPNVESIEILLEFMESNNAFFCRLSPAPKAKENDILYKNLVLGSINSNDDYSICLQTSIWNREKLIELIQRYHSAWEIEYLGSKNYPQNEKGYCLSPSISKTVYMDIGPEGAIHAGKWTHDIIKYAKINKIELSKEIPRESKFRLIIIRFKKIIYPFIKILKSTRYYKNYRDIKYNKRLNKK